LACTIFRLTPEEALAGITREGARALGILDDVGTLEVGKAADLAIWNISSPAELSYWLGAPLLRERVFAISGCPGSAAPSCWFRSARSFPRRARCC
jgi:imidazolonepropionase